MQSYTNYNMGYKIHIVDSIDANAQSAEALPYEYEIWIGNNLITKVRTKFNVLSKRHTAGATLVQLGHDRLQTGPTTAHLLDHCHNAENMNTLRTHNISMRLYMTLHAHSACASRTQHHAYRSFGSPLAIRSL